MDFQSAMETFAEAWAAANTVKTEVPSDLSQVSFLGLVIFACKFILFFCCQITNVYISLK